MPVRNQNWYDLQEGRRYPLDDRGTGVSDDGSTIRDNILVDCHIKFPQTYGEYPYVTGLTVTENIVTVVIAAASDMSGNNSRIIGAISVPKPITTFTNYAITPTAPGIAGWIAFGSGCAENFVGKYSTPQQTLISARNARPYREMPVRSVGKYGIPDSLQDIIKITADAPVTAEYTTVKINGKVANAIVFSLRGQFTDDTNTPLKEFLGPCGQRPESGTCPKEPILTINGIKPDCAGNINISVDGGLVAYMFESCGGMGVDFPIGLSKFCPKEEINPDCTRDGKTPVGQGNDLCEPSASSQSSSIANSSSNSSNSSSTPAGSSSSSAEFIPCLSLPYCKNLISADDSAVSINFGMFNTSLVSSPPICDAPTSSSSSSSSSSGATILTTAPVLQATSVTGFNILTLKNCATDWAINQKISATFKLTGGAKRNGGVVVNYLTPAQTGNHITFLAAIMDIEDGKFKLIRYNGTNVVTEFSETFSAAGFIYDPSAWYTATITPSLFNTAVILDCSLKKFSETNPAISFSVSTNNYGFIAGRAGVISNQAYTYFSNISIGE